MRYLFSLVVVVLLISCSSKNAATSNQLPEIKETNFKGEWNLSSIQFDGFREYSATLLGDQNDKCFRNSTWKFVSNNNRGAYTITDGSCVAKQENFIWNYTPETNKVMIKPTGENYKSQTGDGYTFLLGGIDANSMTLTQTLTIDGGPVVMTMNFFKQNQ
ncbi:MAG: lipocalin family protein [Nonlabens sp.]